MYVQKCNSSKQTVQPNSSLAHIVQLYVLYKPILSRAQKSLMVFNAMPKFTFLALFCSGAGMTRIL